MVSDDPQTYLRLHLRFDSVHGTSGEPVGGAWNFTREYSDRTVRADRSIRCGNRGELGTLQGFMHGSDAVLRCPICDSIVLRIVQSTESNILDLRGATFLRIPKVVR